MAVRHTSSSPSPSHSSNPSSRARARAILVLGLPISWSSYGETRSTWLQSIILYHCRANIELIFKLIALSLSLPTMPQSSPSATAMVATETSSATMVDMQMTQSSPYIRLNYTSFSIRACLYCLQRESSHTSQFL